MECKGCEDEDVEKVDFFTLSEGENYTRPHIVPAGSHPRSSFSMIRQNLLELQ